MVGRALIVLGGGLYPDGSLPHWAEIRADHAARLWHTGGFDVLLTSGRGPVPHLRTEAKALADTLIALDVPADRIVEEDASKSTLANAYYCRVAHTDPLGIGDVAVVTNGFHARRVERIFSHVYGPGRVGVNPADDRMIDPTVLEILRANDEPQDEFLTRELLPRIQVGDLNSLHEYLFDKHSELAGLWPAYRARHQAYRDAWDQLTALMTGHHR
ncbi:YdcF family protein [Nocardia sp. CDC159]|uniref:YdcF family protein n=1 Tax=Nocardia pulmonis TaxID=2951408 RepID=A0A9X2E5A3_9NOCA|nr:MULTISPECIES: YdcF family protein [Nocardia]MCM6774494.1 YdcF family protein [Nocardia pulmonis]MCM6787440.1 YdcF family protein [Nocardia sp. CDC159]